MITEASEVMAMLALSASQSDLGVVSATSWLDSRQRENRFAQKN